MVQSWGTASAGAALKGITDITPSTEHCDDMEAHDASAVAHSRWTGYLAGAVAAGVALGFGELIEGISDDIPSLVVAVGEVVVDYTPGDAVAASIETLGSNQKSVLLTGITIVALLFGGVLGDLSKRRSRLIRPGQTSRSPCRRETR